MKNKLFCLIIFTFSTTFSLSQTKLIHHKSHSGSAENFKLALENNLFGLRESNFGEAPQRIVRTAELDTLIYLSDTSSIMVTKEVCRDEYRPKANPRIWKAGRDTVYHHALFTLKYELDSIKKTLRNLYNFQNPVADMVFIGYGNERPNNINAQNQPSKKELKKLRKKRKKSAKELQKANEKVEKAEKDLEKSNENLKAARKKAEKANQQFDKTTQAIEEKPKEQLLLPLSTSQNPPISPNAIAGFSIPFLIGFLTVFSLLTGLIYWKFAQLSKVKLFH